MAATITTPNIVKAHKEARKAQKAMYLYCTAARWVIAPTPPPFNRRFDQIGTDGTVTYHEYDHENAVWRVQDIGIVGREA